MGNREKSKQSVIVGFYEQANLTCGATYTALLRDVDMLVVDISSYKGRSFAERYSAAFRDDSNMELRRHLVPESLVLAVYLEDAFFTGTVQRNPDKQARDDISRGVVFTPCGRDLNQAHFIGTLENLKRLDNARVQFDKKRRFFCPLRDRQRNRCGRASLTVHNSQRNILPSLHAYERINLRQQVVERFGTAFHCEADGLPRIHVTPVFSPTPIVWINLADAKTRRTQMERQLQRRELVARVQGIEAEQVQQMLASGRIRVPVEYIAEESGNRRRKRSSMPSFAELACTLSHILAIQHAYAAGYDKVVIAEDDVLFDKDFDERLEHLVEDAPEDWGALQLFTLNKETVERNMNLYFTSAVRWFPTHWSTAAYMLSRPSMHSILCKWLVGDVKTSTIFRMPEDQVILADESIYSSAQAYTATRALISLSSEASHSSVQPDGRGYVPKMADIPVTSDRIRSFAPDSLLILTTVRVSHGGKLVNTLSSILANYKANRQLVRIVAIDVYIVCATHIIAEEARKLTIELSEQIGDAAFSISTHNGRFNKFFYVAKSMGRFNEFERVLLIDSDMSLMGFPLPEFFQRTQDYTVAGTVHGNIHESLERMKCEETRQWFKMFDITWWERNLPQTSHVEVDFIEQAFAFLDGNFASWFFRKILTHEHLYFIDDDGHHIPRESDYGPDLLWCGAAVEWLRERDRDRLKPCVLSVSHAILHQDDRQIGEQAIDLGRIEDREHQAWIERRPLQLYCRHFKKWCSYSKDFVKHIGGRCKLDKRLRKSLVSL